MSDWLGEPMDKFQRQVSPLLEFDENRTAFIQPGDVRTEMDVPRACVLTWFHDGIERLVDRLGGRQVVENWWEDGPHPLYEVQVDGQRVGLVPMPVTGPASASLLEEMIAFGCRSFVACGGAGSLRRDLTVGHLIILTSALRDEGLSHHYLPPDRAIEADADAVSELRGVLCEHGIAFVKAVPGPPMPFFVRRRARSHSAETKAASRWRWRPPRSRPSPSSEAGHWPSSSTPATISAARAGTTAAGRTSTRSATTCSNSPSLQRFGSTAKLPTTCRIPIPFDIRSCRGWSGSAGEAGKDHPCLFAVGEADAVVELDCFALCIGDQDA